MGIFCEINLFKPPDGSYYPGQCVTGLIKYAVDEPMEFDKITTSLKGSGFIDLTINHGNNKGNKYRAREVYVDIDNVIQDAKIEVPVGAYEIKFSHVIPYNIPSSTKISKHVGSYTVRCVIKYYMRIKFERPGFFARNKHFKKEISIIYGGAARLLREPVMYGETKKLMALFSSKESIVNIKATIINSVIPIGGKIEVQYEVENNSNSKIKSIQTQLIEVYKFHATGHHTISKQENVPHTDTKTLAVQCGETQTMPIDITIPSDRYSLDHSKIISREYFVKIEAALPLPHRNVVLTIPVQVGAIDTPESTGEDTLQSRDEVICYDDAPPSYWEAMGETKNEDDDGSEDEYSKEKSKE